jgi:Ser/Thr protein kinase RdoA (MazF antagonist)
MENKPFPVIDSTLSPEYLADWIAEKYGFKNVSCRLLKTNMNHSYRVTADNEEYILRVYNYKHRNIQQVAEEVKLLNKLKDTVSVSSPIAYATKEFIHEINAPEGSRCVVLFSFAEGKKLRHLTTELNFKIGTEVGKFHLSTKNTSIGRVDYSVETLITRAYQQIAAYISEELEEMRFIKNSATVLSEVFSKFPLASGVVHLDIWYDNMNIREDGTVTLFDFDNCGNGWMILDIGYYCMQLFYTEPDGAEYEKKRAAFIDGYRSITPVPDEELELIPYAGLAIWIYYLGVQAERFDNFANIFLSENYIKMMISRVKGWLKYYAIEIPETSIPFHPLTPASGGQ